MWRDIPVIRTVSSLLRSRLDPSLSLSYPPWSDRAKRTVAIMPFLGGAMGAGHTELKNRYEYLRSCFWSIYQYIPNIVMGVTREADVIWGKNESGLPFYDIFLLPNLPKSASLPVSTVQETIRRLKDKRWSFDYVFYTESDQIIMWRTQSMLYDHLDQFPGKMLLPHRLMAYPLRVISEIHGKHVDAEPNKWMNQSCCLPRQNCMERRSWVHLRDPSVHVINYFGIYIPLGNSNFLDEKYRACRVSMYRSNWCP